MDVTGVIVNLSGRINTLESYHTYVAQQLLQRPDLRNFADFQVIWNRQITEVANIADDLEKRVKSLQQLYVNLNMSVSSNFATFTGHTGNTGMHA
jgi:uncharacterized protein YukE